MRNHRLIIDSGSQKGTEIQIPEAGLNLDGNGITDSGPTWRFEISRDSEAELVRIEDGKKVSAVPLRDGEMLCGRHVFYLYRSQDTPLDGPRSCHILYDDTITIGCPDQSLALRTQYTLTAVMAFTHRAKRGAVLVDEESEHGVFAGSYSDCPFEVDRSAIRAVRNADCPAYMNTAGTICCVAIPDKLSNDLFVYVEADGAKPFDLYDLQGLAEMVSYTCALPASLEAKTVKPLRYIEPQYVLIDDKTHPPFEVMVRIVEPGTTLGPEGHGSTPLPQRSFVARGAEILRRAIAALPEIETAGLFFTRETPYGPAPEIWFRGVSLLSQWVLATTMNGPLKRCTDVFGTTHCVALHLDLRSVGLLYVNSKKSASPPAEQLSRLVQVAESAMPLIRDIVGEPCEIIGKSPAIEQVREFVVHQAEKDTPVLIQGESGTGRNLVARSIHRASRRAGRNFWADIGTTDMLNSLYGLGTDGADDRLSVLQRLDGGTVYLQGIEDLGLDTQAELLRFMREGTFKRIGGTVIRRSNVRIIFGTDRNLEDAVSAGQVLEDFYWHFRGNSIVLPRLSDHRDDIPFLVEKLLKRKHVRLDAKGITPEAIDLLKKARWTGNVSHLENALTSAAMNARGELINSDGLLQYFSRRHRKR